MTKARVPLRVGFVGCGRVTQSLHLPALQRLPIAEVVAAADADSACLQRTADRYRIAKRYADAQALIADPAVDVVAVCVPPRFHAEIALAALDAGKHV
ncbi:MAG TPA: Gfo/Idh/MocA family oxidoreductase, partial [Bryobacterales bacterium]|nr:Gfo/Idh/MocA family oxidoreductase [Bryobacterales bacterium]